MKTIGYVISLNKKYFKVKDLTKMLGVRTQGRHRLSYSLKALLNNELIEIYHKNSRNLYYIPAKKRLLDAYYESLWNLVLNPTPQCKV